MLLAGPADIPVFIDATDAAGLSFVHETSQGLLKERHMMTAGLAAADFDRDGWLDLFVQGGAGQNAALFMNNRDGTFTDEALARGIDLTEAEGSSVTVGDVDGDGWPDVYAGTIDGINFLFRNTGNGFFEERGLASGTVLVDGAPFDTYGATFGDVDLDGDLDLVTVQWGTSPPNTGQRLFLNDGRGVFTDATAGSGLFAAPGLWWGFAPTIVDMNGDRRPEVLVAADFRTSQYYANDGDGTFTMLGNSGVGTDENGMGSAVADIDDDGDLDWFVTSIWDDDGKPERNWGVTGNRLYRNDGHHKFTDVTDLYGVREGHWGWGASAADFDLDGRIDLVMTNGFLTPSGRNPDPTFETDPARLWLSGPARGLAQPRFTEASKPAGLIHTAPGKGLVTFDGDHDGDLDVVMTTNHGPLTFFRSTLDPPPARWVEIDLIPPAGCAPDGVGATVEVRQGAKVYRRTVFGAPSFMSQDPYRIHIGLPAASPAPLAAVVHWPDGSRTLVHDLRPGRVTEIAGP